MKIATWNVNGIRARQAQLEAWLAREQPDVRLPAGDQGVAGAAAGLLCDLEGYWCYWHGDKGYSGVALLVSRARRARAARVRRPAFDFETPHRHRARLPA